MTDPFDALREPVAPLAPRDAFARELRRRIVAALGNLGEENHVPTLEVREYTPARLHALTPYLAVALLYLVITLPLTRITDWLIARDRAGRTAGARP